MRVDVAHHGVFQFGYAVKHPTFELLFRQIPEKPFHHVEPGCARGREMDVESLVEFQPAFHFGMFVCSVVVANDVDLFVSRNRI